MNKLVKIGGGIVLAVLVVGGIYVASQNYPTKPRVAGIETAISNEVSVKVENFETKIAFQAGMTALAATKIATKGEIITQGEGNEAFVVEILGRTAEKASREYWELVVNGQPALMGAGSLVVKPGDKIEWKVAKF